VVFVASVEEAMTMMYQRGGISTIPAALNHAVAVTACSTLNIPALQDHEFELFRSLIYRIAGVTLSPENKPLVSGRLAQRLTYHRLTSYGDYYRLATASNNGVELQIAVNLLTTHETHFFREIKHFEFLREQILPEHTSNRLFRVWSAACSSGQEAYSIAMLLDDRLGNRPWAVTASDIDTHMIDIARTGLYPLAHAREIPPPYLMRYCLRGVGTQVGTLQMDHALNERVHFMQHNLTEAPPSSLGDFDVIFLRNVMIYFDLETRRKVISNLLPMLRAGGYFLIGHTESMHGVSDLLQLVLPAVYRKPGAV
jgi:chemotaxis protein methyltransferase CheR